MGGWVGGKSGRSCRACPGWPPLRRPRPGPFPGPSPWGPWGRRTASAGPGSASVEPLSNPLGSGAGFLGDLGLQRRVVEPQDDQLAFRLLLRHRTVPSATRLVDNRVQSSYDEGTPVSRSTGDKNDVWAKTSGASQGKRLDPA